MWEERSATSATGYLWQDLNETILEVRGRMLIRSYCYSLILCKLRLVENNMNLLIIAAVSLIISALGSGSTVADIQDDNSS